MKQRGIAIMTVLYLVAALAVFGAGTAVVLKFTSAIERAKTAESEAKEWRRAYDSKDAENAQLKGDLDVANKLAVERGAQRDIAQQQLTAALKARRALAASNPDVAANLATPVHPAIRSLRRAQAGCDPNPAVQCTPSGPRTDAGAPAEGRHGGRPDRGERRSESGVAELERR